MYLEPTSNINLFKSTTCLYSQIEYVGRVYKYHKTWYQKFTFTSRLDLLFNIIFLLGNLGIDFMLLGKHGSSSQRSIHHVITL